NCLPFLSLFPLETRVIIEVVVGWLFRRDFQRSEQRTVIHQRGNDLEIFLDVGPRVNQSAGGKQSAHLFDEPIGKQSATTMSPLPPRIWKIDMDGLHRMRSDVLIEKT